MSLKDTDGIGHAVEVQADTMYEAAVLALKTLRRDTWISVVGPGTRITVHILEPPVEHFGMICTAQLTRWLDGGAKSPAEAVRKKRLKEMLTS